MTCFVPNHPPINIPIPKAIARGKSYCHHTMIAIKLPINQNTLIAEESHFAISAGSLRMKVLLK
jgi:hypothetical protein